METILNDSTTWGAEAAKIIANFSDINTNFRVDFPTGHNIATNQSLKAGNYLNASGAEIANGAFTYDQTYHPVYAGMKMTFTGGNLASSYPVLIYNSAQVLIKTIYGNSPIAVTIPDTGAFVRFNLGTSPSYMCVLSEAYSLRTELNKLNFLKRDVYLNDRGLNEYKSVNVKWSGTGASLLKSYAVKTYAIPVGGLINTIFIPAYSETSCDWILKIFKNSTTAANLIHQEIIDSNTDRRGGVFKKLSSDVAINTNDVIFVYITSQNAITAIYSMVQTPGWGRERLPHYFSYTYDTLSLNEGNAAQRGFEPYLAYITNDAVVEILHQAIEEGYFPEICIPPYSYAVIGKELVYYDANYLNVDDRDSRFIVKQTETTLSVGKRYPRGLQLNHSSGIANNLMVEITDTKNQGKRKLINVPIVITPAAQGAGSTISVMVVGDSIVNSLTVSETLYANLAADSITVNQIGTRGIVGNRHEGRGSWSFDTYLTEAAAFPDVANAFWDSSISGINFQKYFNDNKATYFPSATTIDHVVIYLGTNDVEQAGDYDVDLDAVITNAKSFIDILRSADKGYPNCKITFVLPSFGAIPPSLASVTPVYQTTGYYPAKFKDKIIKLNNKYISELSSYSDLKFAPVFLNVDRLYGHGISTVQASTRITTNETVASNFIHPATEGMQQIADSIYATLKSFL